jgi:predicted N-formylglutamate amidohydrolase
VSDRYGLSDGEIAHYSLLATDALDTAARLWNTEHDDVEPTYDDLVSTMSSQDRNIVKLYMYIKTIAERNMKMGIMLDRTRRNLSTLSDTLRDAQLKVTENNVFDGNGGVVVDAEWIVEFCQAMNDPLFLTEPSDLAMALKIVNLGG